MDDLVNIRSTLAIGYETGPVTLFTEIFDSRVYCARRGTPVAELSYFHLGERDAPGRPTRNRSLETGGGRLIRAEAGAVGS